MEDEVEERKSLKTFVEEAGIGDMSTRISSPLIHLLEH